MPSCSGGSKCHSASFSVLYRGELLLQFVLLSKHIACSAACLKPDRETIDIADQIEAEIGRVYDLMFVEIIPWLCHIGENILCQPS